jgi:hypothetical protein
LPSFVAICTPQGLVVKVTCMHDGWMTSWACIGQELPCQPSTFVHNLARPERLGIIAWLLHCCCSLVVCAKDMAAARPCLIVAMNTQALCPTSCMHNGWSQNALS